MLVIRRRSGQWVEITHSSGDVLKVKVCNIRDCGPFEGQLDLIFDDAARNFEIQRPERAARLAELATNGGPIRG